MMQIIFIQKLEDREAWNKYNEKCMHKLISWLTVYWSFSLSVLKAELVIVK